MVILLRDRLKILSFATIPFAAKLLLCILEKRDPYSYATLVVFHIFCVYQILKLYQLVSVQLGCTDGYYNSRDCPNSYVVVKVNYCVNKC